VMTLSFHRPHPLRDTDSHPRAGAYSSEPRETTRSPDQLSTREWARRRQPRIIALLGPAEARCGTARSPIQPSSLVPFREHSPALPAIARPGASCSWHAGVPSTYALPLTPIQILVAEAVNAGALPVAVKTAAVVITKVARVDWICRTARACGRWSIAGTCPGPTVLYACVRVGVAGGIEIRRTGVRGVRRSGVRCFGAGSRGGTDAALPAIIDSRTQRTPTVVASSKLVGLVTSGEKGESSPTSRIGRQIACGPCVAALAPCLLETNEMARRMSGLVGRVDAVVRYRVLRCRLLRSIDASQ
jgi:hypothetical protein